jgi:hypothetical protein
VTVVPVREFENKDNTDFFEEIQENDEDSFLAELCSNCDIFAEKYPQLYTNL